MPIAFRFLLLLAFYTFFSKTALAEEVVTIKIGAMYWWSDDPADDKCAGHGTFKGYDAKLTFENGRRVAKWKDQFEASNGQKVLLSIDLYHVDSSYQMTVWVTDEELRPFLYYTLSFLPTDLITSRTTHIGAPSGQPRCKESFSFDIHGIKFSGS